MKSYIFLINSTDYRQVISACLLWKIQFMKEVNVAVEENAISVIF
jgi:hypothetical protein